MWLPVVVAVLGVTMIIKGLTGFAGYVTLGQPLASPAQRLPGTRDIEGAAYPLAQHVSVGERHSAAESAKLSAGQAGKRSSVCGLQ